MHSDSSTLKLWGWDEWFHDAWNRGHHEGLIPARIVTEHRDLYGVIHADGESSARLSGKFRHAIRSRSEFPAVGDWVAMETSSTGSDSQIQAVLPRKTCFSRKVPGRKSEEQVVSANADTVFLVTGLDGDYNPRRLERYLALAYTSGAAPVVVLTKTDLHEDISRYFHEAESIAPGVPVIALSSLTGEGLDRLDSHLLPGRTVAFLGSSGAGKSTLVNRLLGEERQRTIEVRENDSRGRHATTHRELFLLPGGALVIDNPGMRELQLWAADEGIGEVFPEISGLAEHCRFRDCSHGDEPGCAIRSALEDGTLDIDRYEGFLKLKKEQAYLERRTDYKAMQDFKREMKSRSRSLKTVYRLKGRDL